MVAVVVAAGAGAVVGQQEGGNRLERWGKVGGMVGAGVSAGFLLMLGAVNGWILVGLGRRMGRVVRFGSESGEGEAGRLERGGGGGGGCIYRVLKSMFRLIDRPWKMYPLGVLFGLGFDTSTEIALLGISAVQAAKGTSIWLILLFPVMFTAGMCLVDTIDGALMLTLYVLPMGEEGKEKKKKKKKKKKNVESVIRNFKEFPCRIVYEEARCIRACILQGDWTPIPCSTRTEAGGIDFRLF